MFRNFKISIFTLKSNSSSTKATNYKYCERSTEMYSIYFNFKKKPYASVCYDKQHVCA